MTGKLRTDSESDLHRRGGASAGAGRTPEASRSSAGQRSRRTATDIGTISGSAAQPIAQAATQELGFGIGWSQPPPSGDDGATTAGELPSIAMFIDTGSEPPNASARTRNVRAIVPIIGVSLPRTSSSDAVGEATACRVRRS